MEAPSFSEFVRRSSIRYLREYYSESDHIPYRDLYLHNLDIHETLTDGAGQLSNGEPPDDFEEDIRRDCQRLKLDLLMHEEFSQVIPYEKVFEQVATSISNWAVEDTETDTDTKTSLIVHCDGFYYEGLWRAIACIISRNNVRGPYEDQVQKRRLGELSAHREEFIDRYRSLKEEAEEAGLELARPPQNLPNLAEEEKKDHQWLDDNRSNPDYETQDLPMKEAADKSINELVSDDDSGQPLAEMIVEERRR